MPEEKINPKPTPRINAGSVKKDTPAAKPLVDFRLPSEEQYDAAVASGNAPAPKVQAIPAPKPAKPIVGGGGFKKEPVAPITAKEKPILEKASKQAEQVVSDNFRMVTPEEVTGRETELAGLVGKDLDAQNLFTATKDGFGSTVSFGKGKIESSDQLQAILDDPIQRSQFYNEKKNDLARYFNVASEKDFDDKLSGGLSAYEKNQFSNNKGGTIYDPVFDRKAVGINEQGYRSEFNQFAPDPVSEKYQIGERRYQALQQFNKLKANNIASDAYGQPFEKPEDFYTYLQDPVNRDAYQRKNKTTLKQIGFEGVNDLLKTVSIENDLGAVLSRQQDKSKMRVAKGTDVVEDGVIGKGGTLYDENPNSSSIAGVSETDIGKILFEHDLGNSINIDIPDSKRLRGFNSINQKSLVEMLTNQGLEDGEIDEVLGKYRAAYERTISDETYEKNREKMGFYIDPSGKRISKYDQSKEQRALGELDEDERKIAGLYDQIRAIYSQGKKVKGKQNTELSADQLAKINSLKSQITQIKRNTGFFGFNAIPEQEFFSPDGKRLEGEDQKKAQTTFVNTMQGEQKTDLAILKEKRNILYEQVDNLQKRLDKFKSTQFTQGFKAVLPEDYDPEKLDADFKAAQGKNTPWFMSIAKTALPMFGQGNEMQYNDQYKANYIYLRNLADKIVDRKAQLKAINKLVYTNADLTKIDATGVWSNLGNTISKNIAEVYSGSPYLTPADEVSQAASFLQANGMYVNPEVVESLKGLQEDKVTAEGLISSLGVALQMGLYRKPVSGALEKAFTSTAGVATRSYMASRYGRTGVAAFSLFEKAAVTYGIPFATYEISNQDGTAGIAEELGQQSYDKLTGILKLGKFVPNNIVGKMFTLLGRSISGSIGSFVEESAANVWSEFKANGFDIRSAVENAYGKTEDERLMNMRMTAFSCVVFSTGNISNVGLLFKTKQGFQNYLDAQYGENISETDKEILDLLDQTIKNSRGSDDEQTGNKMAIAPSLAVAGKGNTTAMPMDQAFVMNTGPVEPDQKTTTSSAASSGAGSEGIKVEKRTGNLGEEFYVSSKNGVVDNKVVYRYNSETGELEAKGLTTASDEFVPLNVKTRDFIEEQSKEHGIVAKDQVENIAIQNVEARNQSQAKNEGSEPVDQNKVSYQQANETSRRKKERIDKAEASAGTRYNKGFDEAAQTRNGLFTGISEEVKADDDAVKEVAAELSRNFGGKMKINLVSFFQDGKALVTDLARKKLAKVGDYMAPLFRDFDKTFFNTEDFDLNTNEPITTRQTDAIPDKVRESVSRNSLFNQVFGTMVSEGRMSKEDAIDNFIINLLQNSHDKVKEVFGNDKSGLENFVKLRKDFNKFVANKYTGANTFSTTNKFVRNTPMTTSTTKNRKADLKKESADLVLENQKRREIAEVLQDTQEEGAFITNDQIDAVRLLNGDITPQEFMENTGDKTPPNSTPEQVKSMAETKAKGLIDFNKYNEGATRKSENDKTREKYRKELNKTAGKEFGFKSSLARPFEWKQNRRKRKAFSDAAIRQFESQAIRAGISLSEFMEHRIAIRKRTEQQFQEWLKMAQDIVPLYQNASTLATPDIYPNAMKAMELKEKNFSNEKIAMMTGVVLNEDGQPVAFNSMFKVSDKEITNTTVDPNGFPANRNFYSELLTSLRSVRTNASVESGPTKLSVPLLFGKKERNKKVSKVLNATQIFNVADNQELYKQYPDLGLVSVRIVDDSNYPAVSFNPNNLYTGKGNAVSRPGEIIINVQKLEKVAVGTLENTYATYFNKTLTPQLQQAFRQATQHIEGELPLSETSDFITPTSVRTKLVELKAKKLIDENTEKLINDIVDFYADKNVFQFGAYSNLFADISRVLFLGGNENTTASIISSLGDKYDLNSSDLQSLESIYNNYFKSYGGKSLASLKNIHNAFTVVNKFSNLNNEELINAEITGDLLYENLKSGDDNQITTTMKVNFDNTSIEELLTFTNKKLKSIIKKLKNDGYQMAEYYKAVEILPELASVLTAVKKADKNLDNESYKKIQNIIINSDFKLAMEFFDRVINQIPVELDSGGVDVLYEFDDLMDMQDKGIIWPEPQKFAMELDEIVSDFSKLGFTDPNIKTDLKSITDAEARDMFYEMYPGIESFANGIYDPYKNINNFTPQELKESLVDSGLVSQKNFDETYEKYKSNPSAFKGSVASLFLDPIKELNSEETKKLQDTLARQKSMEYNLGTSFYSSSQYAVAKIISEAGSNNKIFLADLKPKLLKTAKESELNWLNFDDFVNSFGDQKSITPEQLLNWASNIPTFISYNPDDVNQGSTVDEVIYLGTGSDQTLRASEALDGALGTRDVIRGVKEPSFVIKRSDGTVALHDIFAINLESIELYERYMGTPEFTKFKKAFDELKMFTWEFEQKPELIEQIKPLIKIYHESYDEMKRVAQLENFKNYKPQIKGTIPNSYKEHMIMTPISTNRLFKDYNNKIINILSEMNTLNKELTKKEVDQKQIERFNSLEQELKKLTKERDSLSRDYYNAHHFFATPHETLMHIRTQIVVAPNGERILHVIELQSDKVQDFRSDVLDIIREDYPVVPELAKIGNEIKNKNKSISNEDLKKELLKRGYDFATSKQKDGFTESDIDTYFKREEELKTARDNFKKTSPITETDQYVEIGLKHALKIASDYGIKKIMLSNGGSIIPAVGASQENQIAGLNTLYNQTIPSKAKKLAQKFNFTVGTVDLEVEDYGMLTPKEKIKPGKIDITGMGFPVLEGINPKPTSENILNEVALKNTTSTSVPGNKFYTLELTDKTFDNVAEGMALFQESHAGAHGATVRTNTGKNIIFALTNPNITTAMHELAHVWETSMTATEKQVFMDQVGHSEWTRETSEAFARGYEKYLYDGKAPSNSLLPLFENFKKWLLKVYGGIKGTPVEMQISEPMRKLYDAMLGEAKISNVTQKQSTDVFDDIGKFINDLKENPQFQGITDDEIYTALMRSGFDSSDVQDYFSLKQRANILKQQQKGGMFKQEADLIQDETEAMRVVRDQKALIDEIENIDPHEYPIILQTLFDAVEDGDVPLAKAIQELIAAKHSGSSPDFIAKRYSEILKAGTSIGRMLQLFRQLTKDTYLSSAEGMFARNEKKGMNIPEGAKDKIRSLANELDRLKELYKQSRDIASSDPFGTSKADPSKTNLQYNVDLYKQMQEATERFIDARLPFEGDDSLTDMYRSFIKGGLMTPGSLSVNTLSNVTKFITGVFVDPLKSGFSWSAYKLGITEKQYTKTSLKDWWAGIRYGMPLGVKRAYKILKDGTMTQSYNNPESYVQGYSFYKSFVKFFGLKLDHMKRAAGYLDASSEELALKHGFKVNMEGKIPYKQQAIAALQGLIGPVPDVIFRAMGATDAVFRDFAYFSGVSEQFKFTEQSDKYLEAIKNAKTSDEKKKLRTEYDEMRKAYITINSDFKNTEANKEAMRYVYNNDNATTELISKIQGLTRTPDSSSSVFAKLARLAGTGIVPFTRIPSNYAVELMEFFVPEYAIAKVGINGYRAYSRSSKIAKGENFSAEEMAGQRRDDARDADRILARALIGTGLQFAALQIVKAGAISGAPSDENEEDKGKSMTYNYAFERPYSINLTLVKERFKEMFGDYKSTRNDLWDKENDLIIDYRALGVFGAALYMQFKESKEAEKNKMSYVNRGTLEQTAEDFAFNVFGNWGSAGSYIIDQTFVRGLMSSLKAITDEDENKLPSFLADFVLTLSSGLVPNSTAWIDKWRRNYMVDYDAKEAPAFKMLGMKVESTASTLFWTKLATKMAERWPFGDATKYVDLPFVEANQEYMPIKVDAFGKPVIQTPKGSVFGNFLYNTFDVFKVTRAYAGYETPDWEALVYLAVKKGDNWESLPSLLPRKIETPSGSYKFAPDEYNNLLQYNAMLRRDMIQQYIIDSNIYKTLIDPTSQINKDPQTGKPVTGVKNPNVLIGYEVLGQVLSDIYKAADQITNLTTYTFVDAEREKIFNEDPERYAEMLKSEMLSPMGQVQKQIYGGQETGQTNIVKSQKDSPYFNINYELIKDPNRFKNFAKGAMKLFKEFNGDPRTLIISAENEASGIVQKGTDMRSQGLTPAPIGGGESKNPLVNKVIEQKKQAAEVELKNTDHPGLTPAPIGGG